MAGEQEKEKMIYDKLQKIRMELKKAKIQKSGLNSFAKYEYYELGDFLPTIMELCEKNKVVTMVSFTSEIATLTVIDCEQQDDKIIFTSPMVKSEIKGANEIQCLGAVETYQRRYLYMTAFEIIEADPSEKLTEDDSMHNIFTIKNRVEKLISSKISSGISKDDIYKKLKLNQGSFDKYMSFYEALNNFEQAIKKV